ncbi:MAG: tRNA pseudouridine(55) synthase TruB [Polyangiaceae bacterium]|nr:tRNA pseudouridine(55) synthase TruB [Polyangiaceae bacterium]
MTGGAPEPRVPPPVPPCGGWVVDKPAGPTSHDIVAGTRRALHTRRVGHAGTLDPAATGVLLVLVGEATKLAPYLTGHSKEYAVRVRFGVATDTLDAAGAIVETSDLPATWLDSVDLDAALAGERARTAQVPPDFSAVRVGGVRAHRAARAGEPLALGARAVTVYGLELVGSAGLEVDLLVTASKGYYVRALARDLGARLGAPAHVVTLRRLASGPFGLAEAIAWPPVGAPPLLPLAALAARALPSARLVADAVARARDGKRLVAADFEVAPPPGAAAWTSGDGQLVAIGEATPDGYRVLRGFTAAGAAAPPDGATD